jgi:hypothetical protein
MTFFLINVSFLFLVPNHIWLKDGLGPEKNNMVQEHY